MIIAIDSRPLISSSPRGIGVYLNKIIDYICEYDRENEYILYTHHPFEQNRHYPDNFHVKVIPAKVGTLWLRYILPKYLKQDKPDIFWGTSHMLPPKIKGIKYIVTFHDLGPLICPKWYVWYNALFNRLLMKKSAKNSDLIISVSESTKSGLIEKFKTEPSKIVCIYEGGADLKETDVTDIGVAAEKFGIKNHYFLYIGAIMSDTNKNIETTVAAFETLARSITNVDLVLAGKAQRSDQLVKLIENSKFSDRIKLTGYISEEEKVCLFKNAEAFVFPTLYEGFGIPVLEAMSLGTPVICSSNSSLTEVGGDAAIYLQNERDPEELASKMEVVLNVSEKERSDIIEKGYAQATKFSWEKCAKETWKVLMSLNKGENE